MLRTCYIRNREGDQSARVAQRLGQDHARDSERSLVHGHEQGPPIAALTPIGPGAAADLVLREPTTELVFPARVRIDGSTEEVLAELRGER